MNSLRGFNRADKGSQNNLVDFSGTDDKPQGSIQSSACSSADEETIFDMTAKGDSLKRKRRKKLKEGESPCDVSGDVVQPDGVEPTNVQSCGNIDSMLPPTNPFWTASPIGDTVSLASSAGEGNP
uniref:Uncharacterized protein n=1 Tax=Ciona savignyi TaxID=51511 RepID=H2Z1W8_CIOSA